jgi:probable phosphoglycerate mutase
MSHATYASHDVSEPRIFRQSHWTVPTSATEILLVRHGESEPYVEGKPVELCDGQDDPPLAAEGRVEAERVAERLAGERIDAIYVTTLRRTVETAAPLAERTGLPLRVERDLREIFLGDWEGGSFRQRIVDRDPIVLRMQKEERWDVIPGAESTGVFHARLRAAIERIVTAHPDGRVVAVTHAGAIATLLSMATGSRPFAFLSSNNGAITTLVVDGERWLIRSFNDTGHLGGIR